MYTKSYILSVLLLLVSVAVCAQYSTTQLNHFITISLGGGEGNTFTSLVQDAPAFKDKAGGDALFQVGYELRKGAFFFGLGASLDYDYCWQKTDSFSHTTERLDREGEEVTYAYHYTDYRDAQHAISVGVPVYFGGNIGDYFYLLAGAKLNVAVFANHVTTTMLETDGTYHRFIHTIENAPSYGYFPAEEYSYRSQLLVPQLQIAPVLELGARLPIDKRRVEMRLGVYAEYHFPLSYTHNARLIDYSQLPTTPPNEQTLQDLHNGLIFNALHTTSLQSKAWSQFAVGIKWTCLFNVTRQKYPCRCIDM